MATIEYLSDWNKKHNYLFPLPLDEHYMWNMVRIGFTASEEMSFENVDTQTTDAYLYYKLTDEPSAQVS